MLILCQEVGRESISKDEIFFIQNQEIGKKWTKSKMARKIPHLRGKGKEKWKRKLKKTR